MFKRKLYSISEAERKKKQESEQQQAAAKQGSTCSWAEGSLGPLAVCHSRQITETLALYYTTSKNQGGKFRPWESEVKTKHTPVLDSTP